MTMKVFCDKCGNTISNDNLNVPAHNIGVDAQQWQACDPCFTSNNYATLLPGVDAALAALTSDQVKAEVIN